MTKTFCVKKKKRKRERKTDQLFTLMRCFVSSFAGDKQESPYLKYNLAKDQSPSKKMSPTQNLKLVFQLSKSKTQLALAWRGLGVSNHFTWQLQVTGGKIAHQKVVWTWCGLKHLGSQMFHTSRVTFPSSGCPPCPVWSTDHRIKKIKKFFWNGWKQQQQKQMGEYEYGTSTLSSDAHRDMMEEGD